MNVMTSRRRASVILVLLLAAAGVAPAGELGRVHFQLPGVDLLDSRAEPVESGSVIRTADEAAAVHLDNGQVLRLDANTAARLDEVGPDDVKVTVLSGRVLKWATTGGALQAGAGSWFVLGPSQASPLVVEALLMAEPATPAPSRSRARPAPRAVD
jgi:hypothetical protein